MSEDNQSWSDKAIVTNVLNGNIETFAIVVKNSEKLIAQIVRKMITNEDDQKDLIQDIYIKVYKNLGSFKFKSKLSTWIANIAYNTTVNYLQKKRIPIIGIEHGIENDIVLNDTPEMVVLKTEEVGVLYMELNKLPPLLKTLITLYHLEELPNKEIAEITNLPEGTIKSYLYRARKILKDNINHHYEMKNHE